MREPDRPSHTAYHEAGHAVAAWALGGRIAYATIVPEGTAAGKVLDRMPGTLIRMQAGDARHLIGAREADHGKLHVVIRLGIGRPDAFVHDREDEASRRCGQRRGFSEIDVRNGCATADAHHRGELVAHVFGKPDWERTKFFTPPNDSLCFRIGIQAACHLKVRAHLR